MSAPETSADEGRTIEMAQVREQLIEALSWHESPEFGRLGYDAAARSLDDYVAAARADERERMLHVLGGDFDWITDALEVLDRLHRKASEVSRSYWSPKPEHALTDRQRNDRVHSILGGLPLAAIGLRALRTALSERDKPPVQHGVQLSQDDTDTCPLARAHCTEHGCDGT